MIHFNTPVAHAVAISSTLQACRSVSSSCRTHFIPDWRSAVVPFSCCYATCAHSSLRVCRGRCCSLVSVRSVDRRPASRGLLFQIFCRLPSVLLSHSSPLQPALQEALTALFSLTHDLFNSNTSLSFSQEELISLLQLYKTCFVWH